MTFLGKFLEKYWNNPQIFRFWSRIFWWSLGLEVLTRIRFRSLSLDYISYSRQVDVEVKFYKYKLPILVFRGILKATLITLWFNLAEDFQINT